MASPGNQQCAHCIGALSFRIHDNNSERVLHGRLTVTVSSEHIGLYFWFFPLFSVSIYPPSIPRAAVSLCFGFVCSYVRA